MPKFEALLSQSGVIVGYRRDRAGIDTGLHLFARGEKSTKKGDDQPFWHALAGRVWFQLKGVHAATLSADAVDNSDHVAVSVGVEHLKFWFAAPEPVYLVVYVESIDTFIGIDVRELVEREWQQTFYASMRHRTGDVTVHVPTTAIMNLARITALVNHQSMRIDGPAFRGRPLGHRIDPLRSVLAHPPTEVWGEIVTRILRAHDFREASRDQVGELTVIRGTLAQMLLWQSPAFAEYGYRYSPDEVRDEPAPEQAFGDVYVVLDSAQDRGAFDEEEAQAVSDMVMAAVADNVTVLVFFRGFDLSSSGGLWRSAMRALAMDGCHPGSHQLGLEALSYLVLTATLVYVELAPDLDWDHANYLG
ncbi:DUF4365 domain-containing protein [Rathayibacter sp. VKM Ac-2857]|uniref:DUF4365 domain-containing protein n=1 Tax=Rathayibacter sp. VKM Ac-2857 TaxID=2739020 RepID=UPI0015678EB3|nr:DUF4365 domain-containing protein [Rathayibacter sp. VKM Ac-2857]NQX14994.1 DUF4365 domain-containing protein [Rathayibacter sp. VKM Ac-2857]